MPVLLPITLIGRSTRRLSPKPSAVQARRLVPTEAVQFVTARLRQQLRNQVRIVD